MSDLPKRLYRGTADRAHADTELALSRLRADAASATADAALYTPTNPTDWAVPRPTTIIEAIDRIVAAVKAEHPAREI